MRPVSRLTNRLVLLTITALFTTASSVQAASPARQEFDQLESQYKDILQKAKDIRDRYAITDPADRPALKQKFEKLLGDGDKLRPKLAAACEKSFRETPDDRALGDMLVELAQSYVVSDNYEEARRISELLLENKYSNPRVYNLMGAAAYFTNDYETAEKFLQMAQSAKNLDANGKRVLASVGEEKEKWAREQKFREAEAKADDLPRVKLTIADSNGKVKGDIVVELFENEAPNTVANFVSLVDKHFYDGLPWHRVLPNFMAQGGDPNKDGTGGPGYRIADECFQDNHRDHFRGSLSMAHGQDRDTGGSQFYLTFIPTTWLDGKHTVFGRVIEGMDLLSKIQRVDPQAPAASQNPPDQILKAVVIRKRQHKYEPKTLRDRG